MTTLRPLLAAELPTALTAIWLAFGGDPHPADQPVDLALMEPPRTLAAFDGATPVATAGSFALGLTLPGAHAGVAGVTWVSVSPLHRRRGLLTALMRRQLDDLRGSAQPLAALWASEGAIYQRFGYGLATRHLSVEVTRGAAFTRPVSTDGLELVVPTAARLAPAFDRVRAATPGSYERTGPWWDNRLHDPEHRRGGASALRCVVDGDDGYALYATKSAWGDAGHAGVAQVRELMAATPESAARLWRYLLDLDLMGTVTAWGLPLDTPLLHLLADPRAARPRLGDALWVRLVDVEGALPLRRYGRDVDLVLEVTDAFCPWNARRYRLAGDATGATCSATTSTADLTLDVRALGGVFLGGTTMHELARAGWVSELTPGAVAVATTAFGWPGNAPHCPLVF